MEPQRKEVDAEGGVLKNAPSPFVSPPAGIVAPDPQQSPVVVSVTPASVRALVAFLPKYHYTTHAILSGYQPDAQQSTKV